MNYKTYKYDTYNIYTIQTDKFKNCYIELNFREDIRDVNLSQRSLLGSLMIHTSKNYPTKRELAVAKEDLYNPYMSQNITRVGYNLFTSFSLDFINPKYISEQDYLEKCLAFYFDILLNPNQKEGHWDEKSFNLMKDQLHLAMDEYKERPTSFAIQESKKELFPDSILGKRLVGEHEQLEEVTRESVCEEYDKMFAESKCDILIIGNLNMDEVIKYIQKYFYKPSIVQKEIPLIIETPQRKCKEHQVEGPYTQTQLVVYYSIDELSDWERNFASQIFFRILGSSSGMNDKLTDYLRVKNSLCYFCGSSAALRDSVYVIYVGLNKESVNEAQKWIDKAVLEMANGQIDEEMIEIQKSKFLTDLRLREDSIYGLIDNYYFHEISGRAMYDEYIAEIPKITKQDLQKIGKKLHKIYQYVLKEAEHEDN